jgi:hypothetical protein
MRPRFVKIDRLAIDFPESKRFLLLSPSAKAVLAPRPTQFRTVESPDRTTSTSRTRFESGQRPPPTSSASRVENGWKPAASTTSSSWKMMKFPVVQNKRLEPPAPHITDIVACPLSSVVTGGNIVRRSGCLKRGRSSSRMAQILASLTGRPVPASTTWTRNWTLTPPSHAKTGRSKAANRITAARTKTMKRSFLTGTNVKQVDRFRHRKQKVSGCFRLRGANPQGEQELCDDREG